MNDNAPLKLLYLVTEDWFFCSHFIERAAAAKDCGYDVIVMTNLNRHAEIIKSRGLRVIPLTLNRGSINPFCELKTIAQIIKIYLVEKPDLVHHVALKPVLYGSLAAWLAGVRSIINAPVGMGYIFTSTSWKAQILRFPVKLWLKTFLNRCHSRVIFENSDDLRALVESEYVKGKDAVLIRGAGIDLTEFRPLPEPPPPPVILLTARMLWDKGVGEFVEAARQIKAAGKQARFILAGAPDPLNRASINENLLRQWHAEGVVEWLGHRCDVASLIAQSHIVCLPSYREGLPKSLLEALASGRPVVTTNVQGCREVVSHGINGLLVQVRNTTSLANALSELIESPEKRQLMGQAGRHRAETEFSQERVISETLAVYEELSPLGKA